MKSQEKNVISGRSTAKEWNTSWASLFEQENILVHLHNQMCLYLLQEDSKLWKTLLETQQVNDGIEIHFWPWALVGNNTKP